MKISELFFEANPNKAEGQNTFKLCSFDGGGVKAIGFAAFIDEFENFYNIKFSDVFNGFTGTSSGAVLAILLALGLSGKEILYILRSELPSIFKKKPWYLRYLPFGSKYDSKNLKNSLTSILSNLQVQNMTEIDKFVSIPVVDMSTFSQEIYTNFSDISIYDVLLRTTAAPTYFSPVDNRYVDGAVWENNPSLVGLLSLINQEEIFLRNVNLLSLGHGGPEIKTRLQDSFLFTSLHWSSILIDYLIEGHEEGVIKYCELLPLKKYYRVDRGIEGVHIDSIDSLGEIEKFWREQAKELFSYY